MKPIRVLGLVLASVIAPAVPTQSAIVPHTTPRRAVDLAICLDTSGSMKGLLDAARQNIWAIVNDLALARPTPSLRIALLTFGNDGHARDRGWVRVDTGFTEDLDLVSQKLFALSTNGGTEYVGRVLQTALDKLAWSRSRGAMKLIVVAGNESADQDKMVNFRKVCKRAIESGVVINSIYCGNPMDQIAPAWRQVAQLAEGQFAAINHNQEPVITTPFDQPLAKLSSSLNGTYLAFGRAGRSGKANQVAQDRNVAGLNSVAAAQRAMSKSGSNYVCRWDLVDLTTRKEIDLAKVKISDLPENMRKMTLDERKDYLTVMRKKRAGIQTEIATLNQKRLAHVAKVRAQKAVGESFDTAVRKAVRTLARAKGFTFAGEKGGR